MEKKDPTRTVNVTGDFNVTEVGGEEKTLEQVIIY